MLDFEEADPDTDVFGLGKIEDFSWKGLLDMATCTECGRCQSQCPAWITGKPLSPKMVILDLRDHALAKAPWLLAGSDEAREALPEQVKAEAARPLVGTEADHGVIDPDVIWSCTNCGACVNECPVDIEHIDHIDGMRRHQVLIESAFPVEAAGMLKNLENKGDPWGMGGARRAEWMDGLDFAVPVADGPLGDDVEYLFWVGCAGALEDRARKTTRAIATLLHTAGVNFAVLGPAETCTGDPARRIGNEFVYQMLAAAEHRDAERGQAAHDRRVLPALLQHDRQRVPPARRGLPGHPPHPAAGQAGGRGQAHPGRQDRGEDHLPRPVLPGPAQQGLLPAAGDHGAGARGGRPRRCTGARNAGSAAARAAPGCGWRSASASGSTPSGSTKR